MSVIPETFNPEQEQAVKHSNGPLLIVAGAGTGKTTVITERLGWLIMERKLKPENILALTFTDKAAGEMEDRVDRLLPFGYSEMWISTFHNFGERVLKTHGLDIGLTPDFDLLNETQQWLLLREHLDDLELDYYRPLGSPTKFLQALVRHFSRLKDEAITPEEYTNYAERLLLDRDQQKFVAKTDADDPVGDAKRIQELARAYHTYNQLLRKAGALDFGDLILCTMTLFRERPAVLEQYRQQFQQILVDEFQDTNWAQYALIKMLAAPANNLTVVGDDDQSIYKFRGASIANILTFKQDFPDAATVVLTKNYRSSQNLLDLSYGFIQQNNPNRLEAQLKVKSNPLGTTITKRLTAQTAESGQVELLTAETEVGEAQAVVEKIVQLKKADPKRTWNDFAILVRANNHADIFLQELERQDIPVQFLASSGLFSKSEIMDLTAYLKLLDNYHESTALFRVLSIPSFGVPATDLIELTHTASKTSRSLYETLKIAPTLPLEPTTQALVIKLQGWIAKHAEAAKRQAGSIVIRDFLTDSGLLAEYTKADDRKSQERVVVLNQFFKVVTEFESSVRDRSVRALVHYLDLAIEAGDDGRLGVLVDEGPESVKVMTVHAAKGLEFPFVFLVQLVDKRFPSVGRKEQIELPDALVREQIPQGDIHIEEERRLFYVGLTRAKAGIFLTRALDYGGSREKKPSAFLFELGLLEKPAKKEKVVRPSRLENAPVVAEPTDREPAYRSLVAKDNTFNFSKLITYERCPWQYRYSYVLKVPARPSHAAVFGQAMHQTLQAFFHLIGERSGKAQATLFAAPQEKNSGTKKKPLVSWDELNELYDNNFREEWYPSRRLLEQYRDEGRKALKMLYDSHDGQFQPTYAMEKDFRIHLEPYRLSGRIDRIDRVGGTDAKPEVEIVDYKTGKPQDKLATDDRYQLMIYYAAASDPDVLNLDVKRLTYLYLNDNSSQSYEPKPEDAEKVKTWARGIIEHIKSGDFHATPSVQICKHCDYNDICPYRAV